MKHLTENILIKLISGVCATRESNKYLDHIKKCSSCADQYSEMTFLSEHIKQVGMEQPSAKFTNDLIEKIRLMQKKQTFRYMPLISKKWWSIIVTIILAVFYALIFASQTGKGFEENNFSLIKFLESLLPDLSFIQNISVLLKPEVMIQFIMIIAACWVLIFIDGLVKRVILRIVNAHSE